MSNHGKAAQEALENLHGALADALALKIKSGECTAADLAVARQFLKDNGIESLTTPTNPLGQLKDKLPFPDQTTNEEEE